jgi:hypothetical protein
MGHFLEIGSDTKCLESNIHDSNILVFLLSILLRILNIFLDMFLDILSDTRCQESNIHDSNFLVFLYRMRSVTFDKTLRATNN